MSLTNGLNHVATLTSNLDRLEAFYQDVFGAQILFDHEDRGLRHAMILVGPGSGVHAFEVDPARLPDVPQPMFKRGRLDHIAITATDAAAFEQLRRRAMATGSDGDVVDYGAIVAFNVNDPDGGEVEICCFKQGVDLATPPPDRAAAASRIRV